MLNEERGIMVMNMDELKTNPPIGIIISTYKSSKQAVLYYEGRGAGGEES